MPPRKGTNAWKQQYSEVIVGKHITSGRVCTLYLQNDGTLVGDGKRHLSIGRSPESEAAVVFGMTKIRSFPVSFTEAIRSYVGELTKE